MRKKTVAYLFWLKSNRGTDEKEFVELSAELKKKEIKDSCLKAWCSKFPAWNHPDNYVSFGYYKPKKRLPRPRYIVRKSSEFTWPSRLGWYVWDRWNKKTDYVCYPKKRTANDIAEMKNGE